jgi:hypothetical protein
VPCRRLGCSVVGVEARELREAWFRRALDSAGIERRSWRPGRGVAENRRTVEAVYGYYGRLFTEYPYLQWAGLAAMIGPAFYAGFRDLGLLPDTVRGAVIAVRADAAGRREHRPVRGPMAAHRCRHAAGLSGLRPGPPRPGARPGGHPDLTAGDRLPAAGTGRPAFDVTVTLPFGRAYHARAEMAVMLASAPAGDPDRLTVQLPPASLDATARLLGDYAARWGFPADAVTDWHTSAAQRASGDSYYGTQVFTPPGIGPVHLEFQVSHHVPERTFVVTALLSWHAQAR